MREIGIMEVGGFSVGHAQNTEAATGCTVLLPDREAPCGADVRGGGPASRESQILQPLMDCQAVHAVLLSGGSAFGLDAAGGVQRYLEERGIGFDTGIAKVPLVCQSCLFDLSVGDSRVRPDAAMAYRACENASKNPPAQGNVGAGTGCTVGKYRGMARAMKAGFGTFAVEAGGIRVGALVAVNALGDVVDPDSGKTVAGLLNEAGTAPGSTLQALWQDADRMAGLWENHQNTTLGIVVTNALFAKTALAKIAGMAHNGYARAIQPVHTTADGDTIYALSVGEKTADLNLVGTLGAYAMQRAILRAVRSASPAYGLKAARDFEEKGETPV